MPALELAFAAIAEVSRDFVSAADAERAGGVLGKMMGELGAILSS